MVVVLKKLAQGDGQGAILTLIVVVSFGGHSDVTSSCAMDGSHKKWTARIEMPPFCRYDDVKTGVEHAPDKT